MLLTFVAKLNSPEEEKRRDVCIDMKLGMLISPPSKDTIDELEAMKCNEGRMCEDNETIPKIVPDVKDGVDATGRHPNQQPVYYSQC